MHRYARGYYDGYMHKQAGPAGVIKKGIGLLRTPAKKALKGQIKPSISKDRAADVVKSGATLNSMAMLPTAVGIRAGRDVQDKGIAQKQEELGRAARPKPAVRPGSAKPSQRPQGIQLPGEKTISDPWDFDPRIQEAPPRRSILDRLRGL